MIDVPVLVKDALRDGRLKKNYRFVLGEEEWHEVGSFETIGWYTPSTNYGDDMKYTIRDSKTYRFIVDDADHDTYALYIYKGSDRNWRTVEATSRNTWDITLINESYAYVEIKSSSGNYYSPVSVQNFFAYTIDNNNLVSESVSIDERMCSGDTLKFGLCEGSSLEFQYFDFPNITGQRIQAFVDVESEEMEYSKIYELKRSLYSLPADGRYKITATSANMANIYALFFVHGTTTRMEFTVAQDGHGEIEIPNAKRNDDIYLSYRSGTTPTAEVFQWVHKWHTIPMGFFDVKKCSRQASTGIIKATCYNKLQSDYLDAKANDLIVDIQSDTSNINEVTIQTVMDELLQDYKISYKETAIPISSTSGSIGEEMTNIRISLVGKSGTFYPAITSAKSIGFTREQVNNKRIKFINMQSYVELLNSQIAALKEAWFAKVQNPQTKWNSVVANFLLSCGMVIDYRFTGSEKYSAYFTVSEFVHNSYPPNPVASWWHVEYAREISSNLEYFRMPDIGSSGSTATMVELRLPTACWARKSGTAELIWQSDVDITTDCSLEIAVVPTDGINDITIDKSNLSDVTLRDLVSANYELHCTFGQLSRTTDLFSGVELNHSRLYPADDLYPSEGLYPDGAQESGFRSQYSQLWADEGNIHKWRYLIITYKGLDGDGNETDLTLQRTINNDGTDNYNMSDNWLFRNIVWTAEQVGEYADAMVLKMRDITWFPFEMWCAGLPYLETGDEIEIPLGEETYTSYILQRQLKGIQNLQDTYINGTLDIF